MDRNSCNSSTACTISENRIRHSIGKESSLTFESGDRSAEGPEFLLWRRFHQSKAKLRGVTEIAALLAGFSIVATVELDIDASVGTPLLTAFAVTTALLVTTTMVSIMIATCILPHLEAAGKLGSTDFLKEIPHEEFIKYIDLAWVLANAISILLFVLDVIFLAWIKFNRVVVSAAFTAIMVPVLILLTVFSFVFYRKLVQQQYSESKRKCEEIDSTYKTMLNNITSSSVESFTPSLLGVV